MHSLPVHQIEAMPVFKSVMVQISSTQFTDHIIASVIAKLHDAVFQFKWMDFVFSVGSCAIFQRHSFGWFFLKPITFTSFLPVQKTDWQIFQILCGEQWIGGRFCSLQKTQNFIRILKPRFHWDVESSFRCVASSDRSPILVHRLAFNIRPVQTQEMVCVGIITADLEFFIWRDSTLSGQLKC